MSEMIMLAYDLGTSGVKTSMISETGRIVDVMTGAYGLRSAHGGISEQNADDWWAQVCATTNAIMQRNPGIGPCIAAIGVSGHMLGCLPVDSQGNALRPHMLHSDVRAVPQFEYLRREVGEDTVYRMSGNILSASSSICKLMWVRENEPDVYARTAKFLQSKDFITAKLTGNIDTTDCSDACHASLMDISTRAYDPALYVQLGLDMSKLPQIHKGSDIVGKVTQEAAKALGIPSGIPVIAGGGDGACGGAGAANVRVGDAYLSLGSTAWIAAVTEKPVFDKDRRVFNIMNLDGETSSLFGTVESACTTMNWASKLLKLDLPEMNELAAGVAPGCDGLLCLPYLNGERTPIFDPAARGMFMGMNERHGAAHFSRSVFEGVAYALRQVADTLRENIPLTAVRGIGGGMKSAVWPQIIADITGLRVDSLSVPAGDATSLGVAAFAGMAVGIFPDAQTALSHIGIISSRESTPDARYEKNYGIYKELYPRLKDIMHELA